MAKFKPYKIESSQLESLTKSEGQFIVTTDTQKVYLDETDSSRIELIPVPTKTSDLVNDMNFMSGMTILSYGHSTWNDFITAYTAKHVVYTRASSGSNPASGSQTRLAFMAYVNNADNPTEVEFQYYRSVSTHSDSQQGDQTYVYKLNKTNGWSVTVRENYTKVVAGTGMSSTWSGGKITLNCTVTPPTKTSDLTNDSGFIDNTVDDLTNYTKTSDLATVATSGNYDDLTNKPTIPTVNNATLTIQKNGTIINTFTANASSDVTANITVPTKTSDLTNDSGYTTNTGTITGVSVNGTSVATSGVANIESVPASILTGAIPSAVTATTQTQGDSSTKIATTGYVDTAIGNLPEPMIFKGSLGTGGTITSLPSASSSNEGWTYKVITDGTYASQSAKVGDTFISDGSTWVLIPSGDEPSGTVTSVKIEATSPIAVDSESAITTSGTRTISHANSGVTAGTYKSVTVNTTGHVTAGSNPTTISGYGITDAKIANGVITLGSNTITPLTSSSIGNVSIAGLPHGFQITGPIDGQITVNGTYTLDAACAKGVDTSISAASTSTNLPTSQAVASFVEGKGYLTSYTETDPVFTASPAYGITSTNITNWNNKVSQYSTMPQASSETVGEIVQYIGITDNTYTHGYFYEGDSIEVLDGETFETITTYVWRHIDVQSSNYLAKDNATLYTPTGNYNPATKKYVDDACAKDYEIYYWDGKSSSQTASNLQLFQDILDKHLAGKDILIIRNNTEVANIYPDMYILDHTMSPTTSSSTASYTIYSQVRMVKGTSPSYSEFQQKYNKIVINMTAADVTTVTSVTTTSSTTRGTFIEPETSYGTPFVPTANGHPATKKYVDDSISAISTGIHSFYGTTDPTTVTGSVDGDIYIVIDA